MMTAFADVTFGPGSLESITMESDKRICDHLGESQTRYRVVGTYRIFCGMGNDHTKEIAGQWTCTCNDHRVWQWDDSPWEMASALVELELEDWFDPCDPGME